MYQYYRNCKNINLIQKMPHQIVKKLEAVFLIDRRNFVKNT